MSNVKYDSPENYTSFTFSLFTLGLMVSFIFLMYRIYIKVYSETQIDYMVFLSRARYRNISVFILCLFCVLIYVIIYKRYISSKYYLVLVEKYKNASERAVDFGTFIFYLYSFSPIIIFAAIYYAQHKFN